MTANRRPFLSRTRSVTYNVLHLVQFVLISQISLSYIGYCNGQPQKDSKDVITYTQKPPPNLVALSMMNDEEHMGHMFFQPTIPPTTTTTTKSTMMADNKTDMTTTPDEPKGRALNFTSSVDHSQENNLNTFDKFGDLSDVSMDSDDNEDEGPQLAKILAPQFPKTSPSNDHNLTNKYCEKGGLTYEEGEKLQVGCDSVCTCQGGKMDCTDRCTGHLFRKGKKIDDPLCSEKSTDDPCCSILVCAADTETEPLEMCFYNNKTYHKGERVEKGCDEVCTCETHGKLNCKNRCPILKNTDEKCVVIPDTKDPCCKTVVCDVTLDDVDMDHDKEEGTKDETRKLRIISAKYINDTVISIKFDQELNSNTILPLIQTSTNKMTWESHKLMTDKQNQSFLKVGKPNVLYIRLEHTEELIPVQSYMSEKMNQETLDDKNGCEYKGVNYKIGEEFHDGCVSFCSCSDHGVNCLKIECPTYFGVDVLDPNCVEWDTVPTNFTPTAPKCCPEKLVCKNNGSCEYKGEMYPNWQQLPVNVTGCDKRCYCEMGKVECENICPPVPALPPSLLPCEPQHATVGHHEDECCLEWICTKNHISSNEGNSSTSTSTAAPTSSFFGVATSKQPSKVFGPLLVYTNKENETKEALALLPTIKPEENPYYHKDELNNKKKKAGQNTSTKDDSITFAGPFNPDFKLPVPNKPNKNKDKVKPGKEMFVTPNPIAQQHPQDENENYIPEYPGNRYEHAEDYPVPAGGGAGSGGKDQAHHQVLIHGKGTPEEILQIINQHPELSNYPSGSVLEIHNAGNGNLNGNNGLGQNPYFGHPNGVNLDHLLQEIHKGQNTQQQPPTSFIPGFPPQSSSPYHPSLPSSHNNNGLFHGQVQNGQSFNALNVNASSISGGHIFPPGFPQLPFGQPDSIVVHTLEALDAHTIHLAFTVPPIIVGLHGRVEVRYTHEASDDINTWQQQVFAPPNDLIQTPQLEFELVDLIPDKEYKIKITVTLRDMNSSPTSKVYTIKTLKESKMPSMLNIEPGLEITEINSTWVNIAWRKFFDNELQYIDGVQIRYREIDEKIYAATPLIHRAVTSYVLENLKPSTKYEVGIFFIPFPGQSTELHAGHMIHFTTANKVDSYGFNVTLEIAHIKPTSVEISWSGVPYPEDKYVNIYRAIYQSDSGKGDSSTFKVAKRDALPKTVIMDLKPGTRYRLWLEVYLTNGQIKTSNVQDFITKPRSLASTSASKSDKLERESLEEDNYYGPLVIVAILAAIAIMCTIVLLLMLVRRHSQNKAAITTPAPARVTQSAYDNPTYKVEIQQETMNL